MMTRLEQALALAARGFHVFPIEAGVKQPPRIDDFPNQASRDPEQIRRWWTDPVMGWEQDHNIGISTTRFGDKEALLVVDVDNKGTKNGDATIFRLEAEGHLLPRTCTTRTPTGGYHLIYRTPVAVRQGKGTLGDGVDVRSHGGYIVAAGSSVGAGDYVEETVPAEAGSGSEGGRGVAPELAPDWLVAACGLHQGQGRKDPGARVLAGSQGTQDKTIDAGRAYARGLQYLYACEPVEEGQRNITGFVVANKLKDLGVTQDDCLDLMQHEWNCSPPLPTTELETLIASAYRSRLTAPGSAAPEVQFTPVFTESERPAIVNAWVEIVLDFCRRR